MCAQLLSAADVIHCLQVPLIERGGSGLSQPVTKFTRICQMLRYVANSDEQLGYIQTAFVVVHCGCVKHNSSGWDTAGKAVENITFLYLCLLNRWFDKVLISFLPAKVLLDLQ